MNHRFAILAALVLPIAALAQQQQPTTTAAMGAAQSPSLVGTWQGGYGGYRNVLRLEITSHEGRTVTGNVFSMYPERGCQKDMTLVGTIADDGNIAIDMRAPTRGCEYTMNLKSDAKGRLVGSLAGAAKAWDDATFEK